MKYKSETGVPIPKSAPPKTRHREAIDALNVDESVLVLGVDAKDVSNAINRCTRQHGRRFTYRSLPEGVRVWRMK
jgi:hypothetical protein